ncbi:MAG TPA: hypothetical protein VEB64_11200 [Azospirillaceae bacterium]|nr:hypothetical protein [Azospirillaceae bacterium]
MATKAIVTILIGETYQAMWHETFRGTWVRYARRHDYDIIIIKDYLDTGPRGRERAPHWQKLLVLEHPGLRGYEDVVWIDADILINHHTAPCIVGHNASDKVGVVSYRDEFQPPQRWDNRYHRRARSGSGGTVLKSPGFPDWYVQAGLGADVDDFTNTGVLVMKPRHHADLMRHIYDQFTENDWSHKENGALSYWLFKTGAHNLIDPRFNTSWNGDIIEFYPFLLDHANFSNGRLVSDCVTTAWHNAWMLHFVESETRHHAGLVRTESPVPPGLRA